MAKSLLRLKALELRKQGQSIKEIAQNLQVAKSSVSVWVRDILLDQSHLLALQTRIVEGRKLSRLINSLNWQKRRVELAKQHKDEGSKILGTLNHKELLVAGLTLYWGEGSKTKKEVKMCNSDPSLINFFICWLKECFNAELKDLSCYVAINHIHRERESLVKQYWSKTTGITLSQFTKTSFKLVKNEKVYENQNNHFGTLEVRLRKSTTSYYKIMGLIGALKEFALKANSL